MLEGTWVTEDGLQKYEFVANEDKSGMNCCSYVVEQRDTENGTAGAFLPSPRSGQRALTLVAMQTAVYDEIAEKAEKLITIILVNSDHTAADMRILYDSEENVIKDTDAIYHKQ